MAGQYAKGTPVSSAGSRAEIERTLERFGATAFLYAIDHGQAVVMFEARGRRVRFRMGLPDRNSPEFTRTPAKGLWRDPEAAAAAYEQGVKERWRALAVGIKAKLAMVEAGIVTFEDEFLAHTVIPQTGQTFSESVQPALTEAYAGHPMPALLPGVSP